MRAPLLAAVALSAVLSLTAGAGLAQVQCNSQYQLREGDTLAALAGQVYGDPGKWTLIYYANAAAFGGSPTEIVPGATLFLPCLTEETAPDPAPLQQSDAELRFLTGTRGPLLTDPQAPGGGMITELINAMMEATPNPVPYAVDWNEDWSQHLFPILDTAQADMGFPWARPDCAAQAGDPRCVGFHWSDPVFVLPVQLFVPTEDAMPFASDADLEDKTLCLPEGDEAPWLDAGGRNLLADGHVTLTRAPGFADCLTLLLAGDVDAVPEDIFAGVRQVYDLGLRGQITALERPVGTETLHVVISKKHWRGTTHLYRINAGLAAIKAQGRYDEIVNRHLALYMEKIRG